MVREDRWTVKDLGEMDVLRSLVLSYTERNAETSLIALNRIVAAMKSWLEETKDWLSLLGFPREKHPSPNLSGEAEPATLISYLTELMDVIVSDFDTMRSLFNSVDPIDAPENIVTLRKLLDAYRSRMLKTVGTLVSDELKAKKAEDLELMIWKVKTMTLEHVMLGLVVGTLQNPNPLESLEKLKRIEKCLCDVISDGRVFTLTRRFMPQPQFFPFVQVSQSMELEQHVSNAQELIDLVVEFLDLISDCGIDKLRKNELEEAWDMVEKILAELNERAFAEGGAYPIEEQ